MTENKNGKDSKKKPVAGKQVYEKPEITSKGLVKRAVVMSGPSTTVATM